MELDPLTPLEIDQEIQRTLATLEVETGKQATVSKRAAEAEVAHKVRFAQELLLADGPVAEREATATVKTRDEFLARRIAEAQERASRDLLTSLRARLDAYRTLAANVRPLTG